MKGAGIVLVFFGVMFVLIGIVASVATNISLESSIDGVKARAQVAAKPEDMKKFLVQADKAMNNRGMTSGYTAIFVRSPLKSVVEIRQSVANLIERVDVLITLEPTSAAYQTGIDDVRGTLRELDLQTWGWWIYNSSGRFYYWFCVWGGIAMVIAGICLAWIATSHAWGYSPHRRR